MADIDLDYKGAEQAISDMQAASSKIDSELSTLMHQLAPFANQFVGQAAEAYQQFQTRVSQLEASMRTSLSQGSHILDTMMQGHRDSDGKASQQF
jgi:WXG100 family type VII secretion target